mmetsp:Transcript_1717/g.6045  ORF Transcript_1717/g.6045 Transcript_1717/m.6045 type:complete len:298 (-) Transcript_1717:501-1394(-)
MNTMTYGEPFSRFMSISRRMFVDRCGVRILVSASSIALRTTVEMRVKELIFCPSKLVAIDSQSFSTMTSATFFAINRTFSWSRTGCTSLRSNDSLPTTLRKTLENQLPPPALLLTASSPSSSSSSYSKSSSSSTPLLPISSRFGGAAAPSLLPLALSEKSNLPPSGPWYHWRLLVLPFFLPTGSLPPVGSLADFNWSPSCCFLPFAPRFFNLLMLKAVAALALSPSAASPSCVRSSILLPASTAESSSSSSPSSSSSGFTPSLLLFATPGPPLLRPPADDLLSAAACSCLNVAPKLS